VATDVGNDPLITLTIGENVTRGVSALPGFLRDDLHACEFQPHGASIPSTVLHLKNDVLIQKLLKEFILFKEPDYISNATDYKNEEDDTDVDLRIRPPTLCLFLDLLNDIGFLSERWVQKYEKDRNKNEASSSPYRDFIPTG